MWRSRSAQITFIRIPIGMYIFFREFSFYGALKAKKRHQLQIFRFVYDTVRVFVMYDTVFSLIH